jgi:hypothetical protein
MLRIIEANGTYHVVDVSIPGGRTIVQHAEKDRAEALLVDERKRRARRKGPKKDKAAKSRAPEKAEADPGEVDYSILDGSVKDLIEALAAGGLDAEALLAAEQAKDKPRKSAVRVLSAALA